MTRRLFHGGKCNKLSPNIYICMKYWALVKPNQYECPKQVVIGDLLMDIKAWLQDRDGIILLTKFNDDV